MSYPGFQERMLENTGDGPKLNPDLVDFPDYMFIGKIEILPFRVDELPQGWWACFGEFIALTSAAGQVLYNLPTNFKADWGIVLGGSNTLISLPDLLDDDGNGYFLRPVDGITRQVGSVQGDAMRNIKSSFTTGDRLGFYECCYPIDANVKPFYKTGTGTNGHAMVSSDGHPNYYSGFFGFDASLADDVQVALENRPKNRGGTPSIYLGV
jgi:hypothetical protein